MEMRCAVKPIVRGFLYEESLNRHEFNAPLP